MGTLPNAALQVPLGTAEFVMRYKDEERRQVVPVTMSAPVTVKYELATVVERDPAPLSSATTSRMRSRWCSRWSFGSTSRTTSESAY